MFLKTTMITKIQLQKKKEVARLPNREKDPLPWFQRSRNFSIYLQGPKSSAKHVHMVRSASDSLFTQNMYKH
jgi:hypothetical protein